MHLYKRKKEGGKIWWYKFVYDGVTYQASTGCRNRRDAEGIASAARLAIIEGKYGIQRQKEAPAFKDAMARFLRHVEEQRAERTHERYVYSSKPLIKAFGGARLHQITPDDIEKFKTARAVKLKPATVNNDLACLRSLYSYFIELKVIRENPAELVKFIPPDNERDRVLSFEEERLYLAACRQPLYDIAVLMFDTGMRPDEIYRMRRKDVRLADGYVFNPYGKSKAAKRAISLTGRVADLLQARVREGEGEYVFPLAGDPSQPMTGADYLHRCALKDSGIAHCRLYDLRHTFGTRMVEADVDLVTLAALMGHSKIQMVLRYAHPTEEHKVLAIRKLEEYALLKQMETATATTFVQ
jgi:integrase